MVTKTNCKHKDIKNLYYRKGNSWIKLDDWFFCSDCGNVIIGTKKEVKNQQ